MWEELARQGILDAVVRVLGHDGLQGLTMARVALEAGVAKGTLYNYFPSKRELVKATIETCIGPLVRELNSVLDMETSPDEKLEKLIHTHLGYFDRRRELFRVLMYDRQFAQARWKRYGTSRYRKLLRKVAAVLREGSRTGLFKDLDFFKVAAMLVEADIAVIHERLACENPCPLEDDVRMVSQVFLGGIRRDASPRVALP